MIAYDVETDLIKPGCTCPQLVCASTAEPTGETALYAGTDALDVFERALDRSVPLVGHHMPYDLGVVVAERPKLFVPIWRGLESGKIRCTKVREQLLRIATNTMKFVPGEDEEPEKTQFTLDGIVRRRFGRFLAKEGTWRLRYRELIGKTVDEYPPDAREYPLGDARETLAIAQDQWEEALQLFGGDGAIPDEAPQTTSAFALHLMSAWGLRTNRTLVEKFQRDQLARREAIVGQLVSDGLLRSGYRRPRAGDWKPESRDMKAICLRVEEAYARLAEEAKADGEEPPELPRTETGQVSTERRTLKESGDETLVRLADFGEVDKNLGTYCPILWRGVDVPINPSYNVLVETGRPSARDPNVFNPPREGDFRLCFESRAGTLYLDADYDTAELRGLGQIQLDWFGRSKLAEILNAGGDPHLALAAKMLGRQYEDLKAAYDSPGGDKDAEKYRQHSKPANFGYPGGMGWRKFMRYALGYGIRLSPSQAQALKLGWFETFPEMRLYLDRISEQMDESGHYTGPQIRSGRIRRGRYTAWCNGYFQGLIADGAKAAHRAVTFECYADPSSALFGCRPVLFLYDELILEVPNDPWKRTAAAHRLTEVMKREMKRFLPDVAVEAKPTLFKNWYKGAKSIWQGDILMPVKLNPEPKDTPGWKKWIVDQEAA